MAVSEIIATIKELVGLAQSLNELDLKKKLLDLQGEVLTLMADNQEKVLALSKLKAQVIDLEEKFAFKGRLQQEYQALYETDENGNLFGPPYCTYCWSSRKHLVQILQGPGPARHFNQCPECKTATNSVQRVKAPPNTSE